MKGITIVAAWDCVGSSSTFRECTCKAIKIMNINRQRTNIRSNFDSLSMFKLFKRKACLCVPSLDLKIWCSQISLVSCRIQQHIAEANSQEMPRNARNV